MTATETVPTEDERTDAWIRSCLRTLNQQDILQVGREDDQLARRGALEGRYTWRMLREYNSLNCAQLAAQLGVRTPTISRYESGARWPGDQGYLNWLKDAWARYLTDVEADAMQALMERDGWLIEDPEQDDMLIPNPDIPDVTVGELWDNLTEKVINPWLETGQPDQIEGHHRPEDHKTA